MKIKFLFGSFLFATTKARCPQGYREELIPNSPDFRCEEINECEEGTHDCHLHADCTNTEGSFTCDCKQGKSKISSRLKHKLCDTNLSHLFFTFIWTLLKGFEGDGKSCLDIIECKTGDHECDLNADCINTEGSYTCSCKQGKRFKYAKIYWH